MTKFPEQLTPLNIRAYLSTAFNLCGCVDLDDTINIIQDFLVWCNSPIEHRKSFDDLFSHDTPGVYYLISAAFEREDLITHGMAIRYPFLTENGAALLGGLQNTSIKDIGEATGEAYDGVTYG